jgi:predicted membrane channel-forming protein YqfA (hemolysin III family)
MVCTALVAFVLFAYGAAARGGLYETADPNPFPWVMVPAVTIFLAAWLVVFGVITRSNRATDLGLIVQAAATLVVLALVQAAEDLGTAREPFVVFGALVLTIDLVFFAWSQLQRTRTQALKRHS